MGVEWVTNVSSVCWLIFGFNQLFIRLNYKRTQLFIFWQKTASSGGVGVSKWQLDIDLFWFSKKASWILTCFDFKTTAGYWALDLHYDQFVYLALLVLFSNLQLDMQHLIIYMINVCLYCLICFCFQNSSWILTCLFIDRQFIGEGSREFKPRPSLLSTRIMFEITLPIWVYFAP